MKTQTTREVYRANRDKAIALIKSRVGTKPIIHDWSDPQETEEERKMSFCVLHANDWTWCGQEGEVGLFDIPYEVHNFKGECVYSSYGNGTYYRLFVHTEDIDKDILCVLGEGVGLEAQEIKEKDISKRIYNLMRAEIGTDDNDRPGAYYDCLETIYPIVSEYLNEDEDDS